MSINLATIQKQINKSYPELRKKKFTNVDEANAAINLTDKQRQISSSYPELSGKKFTNADEANAAIQRVDTARSEIKLPGYSGPLTKKLFDVWSSANSPNADPVDVSLFKTAIANGIKNYRPTKSEDPDAPNPALTTFDNIATRTTKTISEKGWRPGATTLATQMKAVQGKADIYKGRSPLDANTHINNIANTLARDYGVNSISDIGVRQVPHDTMVPISSGSDENAVIIGYETIKGTRSQYYNKLNNKTIPGYKFASENRGDGYSEYNLRPVSDGKGGTIVLPVQQYSKSGLGAFVQDIAPALPLINAALLYAGVPPITLAAGNVALQAGAGNINNIGDVLKTAAPVLVGDPGIAGAAAKVYMAYDAFDKGNVLSGLASLASVGGMDKLANDLRFIDAVKNGNVAGALVSVANMTDLFDTPLRDDAGNIIKNADGVVQKVGKIKIGGDDNYVTLEEAAKGATIAANLLSDNPNYGAAIQMAGQLLGSRDTVIAGKAASLIQAVDSGNRSAINNAATNLANQFNTKAPGVAPIENRTANDAVKAAASDTIATLPLADTLRPGDLGTTLATGTTTPVTDTTTGATTGAITGDIDALRPGDLGTKLDPVVVTRSDTTSGTVDNDTLTDANAGGQAQDTQLTSAQIAALTSGNLTSLDTKSTEALTTGNVGTLETVEVRDKGATSGTVDNDTLTSTTTTTQDNQLTSAQIAALTSKDTGALTTKTTGALDPVLVTAQRDAIDRNDDTLTNDDLRGTTQDTQLTSAQIAALTTKDTGALTTKDTGALTTKDIGGGTTGGGNTGGGNTGGGNTGGGTTASPALTSDQIATLTTTDPRGLQALPTSDPRFWRQTGAQGTGGKGGVRFFDWYDTPENRTMASPAMTTQNIPAITSEQLGAITAPTPKRYFNQETNRYYTDPTGTWQSPAGWTQTGLKGGGEVKTNFYDGGMADEDVYSYLRSLPSDNSWDSFSNDLSGYNFADFDMGIDPVVSGYDGGGYNYDPSYDALGDLTYGADAARAAEIAAEADAENVNNIRWDRGDFGDPEDPRNPNYGNEGRAYSGRMAIDPVTGSPINAKTGVPNKRLSSTSNVLKQLADAAKKNPNLTKMLLGAGLGGLLGYMGRPKGIRPKGMQGGSLGLSQGQVYGALKGKPVQRAEGGEIDGYAKGGGLHYLKSAEDGMADKIPATIDNKQPAKLSGGEFVIPADVVSHLGNGNSEAGAKQLYAMMDRIRHARTGNKQQGKQINPAKFTPK